MYVYPDINFSDSLAKHVPSFRSALNANIFPDVVAERLLVEVAKEMERFDAHLGSVNAALQQAPVVLEAICMNLRVNISDSVVDHLATVFFLQGHRRTGERGAAKRRCDSKFWTFRNQKTSKYKICPDEPSRRSDSGAPPLVHRSGKLPDTRTDKLHLLFNGLKDSTSLSARASWDPLSTNGRSWIHPIPLAPIHHEPIVRSPRPSFRLRWSRSRHQL
jgi:hypothetical protein